MIYQCNQTVKEIANTYLLYSKKTNKQTIILLVKYHRYQHHYQFRIMERTKSKNIYSFHNSML